MLTLQCVTEQYVTELFSKSQRAAIHGKRITVQPEDMEIVIDFRGDRKTFYKQMEFPLRSLCPELFVSTFPSKTYVGKNPKDIEK